MEPTELLIDPMRPFSKSRIWELQKEYYSQQGVEVFASQEVPNYITNSPQTARSYAEMIFGFLQDLGRQGRDQETVYLVELGAGTGQLCFHILQYYTRYLADGPDPLPPFCYVLTDLSQETLDFWQTHPRLQEYFRAGILDVALFDVEKDESIYLTYHGLRLEKAACKQPLIVLANYFFDVIPQELVYFESGQAYQVTMSLHQQSGSEGLANLNMKYGYDLLDTSGFDPRLQVLIDQYKTVLDQSHVLIPELGIRCLDRFRQYSPEGMLLLTGDKGIYHLRDLNGLEPPEFVMTGSLSLYLNFHALGAYCNQVDGRTFLPSRQKFNLVVAGFLMVNNPILYPSFSRAYDLWASRVGPDENYLLKVVMEKGFAKLNPQEVVAVLRFFLNDPRIFQTIYASVEEHIPNLNQKGKEVLTIELVEVWENYYRLSEDEKIEVALRKLLDDLGQPQSLMSAYP